MICVIIFLFTYFRILIYLWRNSFFSRSCGMMHEMRSACGIRMGLMQNLLVILTLRIYDWNVAMATLNLTPADWSEKGDLTSHWNIHFPNGRSFRLAYVSFWQHRLLLTDWANKVTANFELTHFGKNVSIYRHTKSAMSISCWLHTFNNAFFMKSLSQWLTSLDYCSDTV